MRLSFGAVREQLRQSIRFDDPTWRLALAIAIGVFISFTPFYGLQTLLAIGFAVIFRLNRAATVAGAWLNLPWFAPLVYAGALKIGTIVVPDPDGTRGAWLTYLLENPQNVSWRDIPAVLDEISLPFLVGTTMLGAVAAAATYVIAFKVITRHRARLASRAAALERRRRVPR
jgi:uncharacterized protein (DUF2062 family)